MLIRSHRHAPADLAMWAEYEAADKRLEHDTGFGFRVANAMQALIDFTLNQPPSYAGTSWGKDSVVLCYLLRCVAPHVPLMHLRPTNHNPDCDAVRDDYFARFPGQSYVEVPVSYEGIDRVSTPHQELDQLTDKRWYEAIRKFSQPYNGRHILGIRGEESTGRRFRMMRWGENSPNASAPIGHWSHQDVFAALAVFDLPVHPAYAMLGAGRWPRDRIRVAEIGDTHGTGGGRREWEQEYYGDVLRRIEVGALTHGRDDES